MTNQNKWVRFGNVGCMNHMQPAEGETVTWAKKRVVKLAQQLHLKC